MKNWYKMKTFDLCDIVDTPHNLLILVGGDIFSLVEEVTC